MKVITPTLQTTYANLVQMHLNRPEFEFQGAPFTVLRKGKTYWYANQRSPDGASPRQRYLGPDTDEMRDRIEKMRAERQNAADFRDHASSLVAQLRAGGIAGPDRKTGPILRALANCGVFRLGGTLVGTHAFLHYNLVLGVHLTEAAGWITQTDDIDIASFEHLSMAIDDVADPDLAGALEQLGFRPAPSLNPKTPTTWTLADASYAIDFLTPSFSEREQPTKLAALKMWAQGLHYLNFLIKDPMPAVTPYMEGLLIQIPKPERYAVHKLIIAQRRRGGTDTKRRKDIEQARAIIWAMAEDRPYEIKSAIAEADSMGEKWRAALDRTLAIRFEPVRPILNGERDVIRFPGTVLGEERPRLLEISGEALDDHFEGDHGSLRNRHEAATRNRSDIEAVMQWKFRHEPSGALLVTTDDVDRWRREQQRNR